MGNKHALLIIIVTIFAIFIMAEKCNAGICLAKTNFLGTWHIYGYHYDENSKYNKFTPIPTGFVETWVFTHVDKYIYGYTSTGYDLRAENHLCDPNPDPWEDIPDFDCWDEYRPMIRYGSNKRWHSFGWLSKECNLFTVTALRNDGKSEVWFGTDRQVDPLYPDGYEPPKRCPDPNYPHECLIGSEFMDCCPNDYPYCGYNDEGQLLCSRNSYMRIIDHSVTQIDPNTTGWCERPESALVFDRDQEKFIYCWVRYSNASLNDTIEWKLYNPNESLVPPIEYNPKYENACVWAYWPLEDKMPGRWVIDVFFNGTKSFSEEFTIEGERLPLEFTEHFISSKEAFDNLSEEGKKACERPNQKTIITKTDNGGVISWVQIKNYLDSDVITWRWHNHTSELIDEHELQVDLMKKEMGQGCAWAGLSFSSLAEDDLGDMYVDVYVNGVKEFKDTFSIIAGCSPNDLCCTEKLYGEYSEIPELLRYFRDNILKKTPEGQELVKLYYQWSPAIVRAMDLDEEFKQEVRNVLEEFFPLIKEAVK